MSESNDAGHDEAEPVPEPTDLPKMPDDVQTFQGCPEVADPAHSDHNCHTVSRPIVEDGDLKLLLYLKCSCGHERRRTIG